MSTYSIKDLEKLSGIKAHTLRIWEKRYNLLDPERTDTNIRLYSDEDLKRLLNVSLLSNNGMKISKIAELSDNELVNKVRSIENEDIQNKKKVADLVESMLGVDGFAFQNLFDQYVEELGFEETLNSVIYPFLERVGILWLTDEVEPGQEHFITHIVRNKIISAIEQLPKPESDKKAILFLPENEFHELGLLYFYYLIKKKGVNVFYLGQSVPAEQVALLSKKLKPNWVISYSIIKKKGEIESLFNRMEDIKADGVYFLENKYQNGWKIEYPSWVSRFTDKEDMVAQVG